MSKGHKFTNIPEIPNASPTSSSPARHPLVRPQPAPRNQHRALKRPSLLTIAPPRLSEKSRRELKSMYSTTGATTNFQSSLGTLLLLRQSPPTPALVRKTALPAHDSPRHQHWCAKQPSLLTIDPRHQPWCAKQPSLLTIVSDTSIGALKRPSLLTIAPRHQQPQPFPKCNQVCVSVNNHGSQLILHEYIKRTSSHPNRIGGRAFY